MESEQRITDRQVKKVDVPMMKEQDFGCVWQTMRKRSSISLIMFGETLREMLNLETSKPRSHGGLTATAGLLIGG